jgi:hypothetical protein
LQRNKPWSRRDLTKAKVACAYAEAKTIPGAMERLGLSYRHTERLLNRFDVKRYPRGNPAGRLRKNL